MNPLRELTTQSAVSSRAWRPIRRAVGVSVAFLVVGFGLGAPQASAASSGQVAATLGALWQTVLETPTPDNPLTGGDPCVHVGSIVAPFTAIAPTPVTCTVAPGTRVFVTAESSECSTVEAPPFYGGNETELRACAWAADAGFTTTTVTLDGVLVPVTEVDTALIPLDLPADNILGVPAQHAFSVAHGWATLLHPLTPGTHTVTLRVIGTDAYGTQHDLTNTTTIVVAPRGQGS
jgi:hypothetical protein